PLLLRVRDDRAGDPCRVRAPVRVLVLTTSYPRFEGDSVVNFLGEAVARLREREVEVDVVSPMDFPHYGIAYGAGIMGNLRRQPGLLRRRGGAAGGALRRAALAGEGDPGARGGGAGDVAGRRRRRAVA